MSRFFARTSSQYLSNSNAALTATPLTMACWFKSTNLSDAKTLLMCGDTAALSGFELALSGSENVQMFTIEAGVFRTSNSDGAFSSDVWTHAAGTAASSTNRVAYIDGVAGTANTVFAVPTGIDSTWIGAENDSGSAGFFMDGDIAEAAFWNVVLTAAELAMLALGVSPLFVRPASLVEYYPLVGRTSPEIGLVGGLGLTLNAAPTTSDHPRIFYPQGGLLVLPAAVVTGGTILPQMMQHTA